MDKINLNLKWGKEEAHVPHQLVMMPCFQHSKLRFSTLTANEVA